MHKEVDPPGLTGRLARAGMSPRRDISRIFGYGPLVRLREPLPHVLSGLETAVTSHRYPRRCERLFDAARAPHPAPRATRKAAHRLFHLPDRLSS